MAKPKGTAEQEAATFKARIEASLEKLAPHMAPAVVGDVVLEMVEAGQTLSKRSLIAELRRRLAGGGAYAREIEAALMRLDPPPSGPSGAAAGPTGRR